MITRAFATGLVVMAAGLFMPGVESVREAVPAVPMTAPATRAPRAMRDSIETQLIKDASAFFVVWAKWWRHSQTQNWISANGQQFGSPAKQGPMRSSYQHCHTRSTGTGDGVTPLAGDYEAILSASSAFSICPSWSFGGATQFVDGLTADESDSADAAINAKVLPLVRAARATLLASYARAQRVLPNEPGIVGQRVRFMLDQAWSDSALVVANACGAEAWWCQLLRGYVHARQHHLDIASFVFDSAMTSMPENEQCAWLDIAPLLPKDKVEQFEAQTCAERRAISNTYWWLADPMYSQPGNERRAEHMARNMRLALISSLPTDGRFSYWNRITPSDALRKLVVRYGWPGYLAWGGEAVDASHDRWIAGFSNAPQPPYTTYEYFPGRVHTAPGLSALDAPLLVADSLWDLNGKASPGHPERWWPIEHMSRSRKLVTIPEGQIALMRRERDVLLATANDLGGASLRTMTEGSTATFVLTSNANSLMVLGTQPISRSTTLRQQTHIASTPALFALEISEAAQNGTDARTRRGIAPPITLSEMKVGEIALSDPTVLHISAGDSALSAPDDALLNRMLGSTTISTSAIPKIGVYWESYGIRDGDTVTVSVRIERRESVSAFRRIGMALNVAADPNSAVKIAWREPDRTHVTRTINGAVPIQVRTVLLDISNLSPGPYALVTEIVSGSKPPATSSRRITLVR